MIDPAAIAGDGGSRFPPAVGAKYYPDGAIRRFPGNTVICPVPADGAALVALVALRDRLRALAEARAFAFTPPRSYHMTLFEGLNDQEREPERWSRFHDLDAPLDLVTTDLMARLAGLTMPRSFRLHPVRLRKSARGGFVVDLREDPQSPLRGLRDALSERTGIRKPDHDGYVFHITLSYQIHWLPAAAAGPLGHAAEQAFATFRATCPVVEVGPPAFCTFEDMEWFEPVLPLSG